MEKDNTRALITGAAGYLGQALLEFNRVNGRSYDYHLVDGGSGMTKQMRLKLEKNAEPLGAKTVSWDTSGNPVRRNDLKRHATSQVIHLGAHSQVRESENKPTKYLDDNVASTLALLEACRLSGKKELFLFASTGAVYSGSKDSYCETDPLDPQNAYGLSKRICEQLVRLYAAQYELADTVVILRLFNIAGAFEGLVHSPASRTRLIPTIIQKAITGDVFDIHWPVAVRDYIHVLDVAEIIGQIMADPDKVLNGAYNVGRGIGITPSSVLIDAEKLLDTSIACEDTQKSHREAGRLVAQNTKLCRLIQTIAPGFSFRSLSLMIRDEIQYGVGAGRRTVNVQGTQTGRVSSNINQQTVAPRPTRKWDDLTTPEQKKWTDLYLTEVSRGKSEAVSKTIDEWTSHQMSLGVTV